MLVETERRSVGLDPNGIIVAADAISHPHAGGIHAFFDKRTAKEDCPRIRDIIDFVCYRCGIQIPFVWAWMCTDFPFQDLDAHSWKAITVSYVEGKLFGTDFPAMENVASLLARKGIVPNLRTALKSQRRSLGLSLGDMAFRLGMERGDVASLERGCCPTSIPRCRTFNKVMVGYEIHPVRLLQLAFTSVADIYEKNK